MKEVTLGEWPSISYLVVSSVSLVVIYFMLAEFYKRFPQLGFSVNSKGGTNEGSKPKDIHYTGAYKTLVMSLQDSMAIFIAANYFKFSVRTFALRLMYPRFEQEPYDWSLIFMQQVFFPFWILGTIHYWFILDKREYIKILHKFVSFNATLFGNRLFGCTLDCVALYYVAAEIPSLLESFGTIAHTRGILYKKPVVYFLFVANIFNALCRFIMEPIIIANVLTNKDIYRSLTPFDYVNTFGLVALLFLHLYFTYRAIIGFLKLYRKMLNMENLKKN